MIVCNVCVSVSVYSGIVFFLNVILVFELESTSEKETTNIE